MGKAAKRRRDNRKRYLVNLSNTSPECFDYQCERMIKSWLDEIRHVANTGDQSVFGILDEALSILEACGKKVYSRYAYYTDSVLCDACCQSVAGIIDPRLYRLSNVLTLEIRA